MKLSITLILTLSILTGCLKTLGSNGYIINESVFKSIKPYKHNKKDILKMVGSPSSKSSFGEEKWYYVSTKNDRIAFGSPTITDQDIIIITFKDNVVSAVENKNIDNRRDIKISNESTPTKGNEIGFTEQILGNLGRYNNNIPVDE